MNGILNAAVGGMLAASNRLNEAAKNIVLSTARASNALNAAAVGNFAELADQAQGPADPAVANGNGSFGANAAAAGAQGVRYIPSLAEEIVQLKIAAAAYKANARLARTADEILQTTVESLKPARSRQ